MKIYLIGIGGIGVSALARCLQHSGHEVSGSDIKTTPITKSLEAQGIKINCPHNKSNIKDDFDFIIYSAAIKATNEELVQACEKNIKTYSRKEALPFILGDKKVYSVCGAHGKSTTTAILASILNSSALIGAISKDFNSNFRYVDELLAFEADESDGSFLLSNPYCALITNCEPEHMEYYNHDLKRFYHAYEQFISMAKIKVLNAEDDFISNLDVKGIKLYPSKDITNISYTLKENEPFTSFILKGLGEFEVWGFGQHIAIDASLAILASLNEMDLVSIKKNLSSYKGIKKRFDLVQKFDDFVIIDDYAHHPTEIEATIKSTNLYAKLKNIDKIIIIWQPHKYSRLKDNLEHFKKCFKGCDELIILPVWSTGEKKIDIDFEEEFKIYEPCFADSLVTKEKSISIQKNNKIIKTYSKGIILGLGAGDITYQLRI